ncbi:MAG: glycosyltransferase [Anaerolineaceae bacterium]|nr:glycosyltransferase [Anaerolineaceae bacterium]
MRIHQLVPSMSPGDATSNHILEIDKRLSKWGFESYIYAQHTSHELQEQVRLIEDLRPYLNQKSDLLIYHYGIFHTSAYYFHAASCRRMLVYHNITPAHMFAGWDKYNQTNCRLGRLMLQTLKECDLAVGDSDFNRQELVASGFDAVKTAVIPIFLPVDEWQNLPVDTHLQSALKQPGKTNWLSVGRVAPNKAIEDVIRLFYVYKNDVNPQAHLYLVGSLSIQSYVQALQELVASLNLTNYVSFSGRVSNSQLKTYYQNAHLFLSASRHEGFCVPLIESMFFELPILARNATVIPETMGQSGILFNTLDHLAVAHTAHLMVTDNALRQQIINTQKLRLQAFLPDVVEVRLHEALQKLDITIPLVST